MTSTVSNHPSQILDPSNNDTPVFLDIDISGGWNDPDLPTLTHWLATFHVGRTETDMSGTQIGSMTMTVVDPTSGDPVGDLKFLDPDAEELGECLFEGSKRTWWFANIVGGDTTPVLLVNTFELEPAWRGTDLTPIIALRVLKIFAGLGIKASGLLAAPYVEDMLITDRVAIGSKIVTMWQKVGYELFFYNDGFMGLKFDRTSVVDSLEKLAGDNPVLRAAADVW